MPRPNASHPEDRLDEEIDSLLRSVETGEKLEPPGPLSGAGDRAWARWLRRPATQLKLPPLPALPSARPRRRRRPPLWARMRSFVAAHGGDLGFYTATIVASVIVAWLIVDLARP
jgi:hypothetical protein